MGKLRRKAVGQRAYAVTTLRDAETGQRKDYVLGAWDDAASREAYHRLLASWEAGGRRLPEGDPAVQVAGVTVRQVLDGYFRSIAHKSADYQANVRSAIRVCDRMYGTTLAANFGPRALALVREQFEGVRQTRMRRAREIVAAFKWAVGQEIIPAERLVALRATPPMPPTPGIAEGRPQEPVPDTVINATLRYMDGKYASTIRLMRLTGMRVGEVCVMRFAEIDTSGPVWIYRPMQHKTLHRGITREIYLGPQSQAIVRTRFTRSPTDFIFKTGPRSHGPVTSELVREAVCRAVCRANRDRTPGGVSVKIPYWRPSQVRHTYATAVRAEFGLEASSILLGHGSAVITDAVYAERDRRKAEDIASRIA